MDYPLTPLQIVDHKQKWKSRGYEARIHTDKRRDAIEYCKERMMQHQWDVTKFTGVYEDTFHFEWKPDMKAFVDYFEKNVDFRSTTWYNNAYHN